ncbi:uncharacterized protein LOC133378781 [Rhineura floridana]|uniref:uncharacterized protein LOC133378781 n=1 Tax=Rhineura floridana TaxID=261503 RepID=UPI002AC86422|nr:uncharacterized protein LOC133378781 [Rhineura floridana]
MLSCLSLEQILLVVFTGSLVSGANSTVWGKVGQNITLPCHYSTDEHGTRQICWGKGRCPYSWCSGEIFRTKTQQRIYEKFSKYYLMGDVHQGDVSLTIVNVTENDAGTYCCRVDIKGWFNDEKQHVEVVIEKAVLHFTETYFALEPRWMSNTQSPPDNISIYFSTLVEDSRKGEPDMTGVYVSSGICTVLLLLLIVTLLILKQTPVAGFAAESSSQLVRPLESQLVDPEEAKLESEVQKGGPVHEEEEGMKQCQLPTATSAEQQVPWFGLEKACTFVSQSGKNVVVRRNYCLPRIKNLRSAVSSSSNVKKHFERAHPEKLRAIEEAIKARRRGLPEPMHDTPPPQMLKQQQTTLERWGSGRDLLLLAACVHPRFKLERLESCQATTHTNKYTMEALLKAEIKMGVLNEDSDQSSDKDQEGDDLEDDFFNFLPQGKKSAVDTAEEELGIYTRSRRCVILQVRWHSQAQTLEEFSTFWKLVSMHRKIFMRCFGKRALCALSYQKQTIPVLGRKEITKGKAHSALPNWLKSDECSDIGYYWSLCTVNMSHMLLQWIVIHFCIVGTISQIVVRGVVGQAVTLPCTYRVQQRDDLTDMCWGQGSCPNSKCSNEILRTNGRTVTSKISHRYQLKGHVTQGDVSLTIANLNKGDRGLYCCRIEVRGWFNDLKKTLNLQVNSATTTVSTTSTTVSTTVFTTTTTTAPHMVTTSCTPAPLTTTVTSPKPLPFISNIPASPTTHTDANVPTMPTSSVKTAIAFFTTVPSSGNFKSSPTSLQDELTENACCVFTTETASHTREINTVLIPCASVLSVLLLILVTLLMKNKRMRKYHLSKMKSLNKCEEPGETPVEAEGENGMFPL